MTETVPVPEPVPDESEEGTQPDENTEDSHEGEETESTDENAPPV